ncbi:Gfo/Idh/MocA family oxidoreductase [Sphingobacterium sp. N143]|mgnify:CR=1 FL=1|uniref:Gfo/Idh/MocA family protein n=1 Tax=Sphingobacterium sp. N143 TaxID=2746727 RepID=UPI0025758CF1|nr:Gfo/Idh/MocA family oxidoreductase [Sphingobacterium sp. N143]MDM1292737.1 Gfo/Idh/MocA family oxidoreductase [Sphingobacterium sp. N143]
MENTKITWGIIGCGDVTEKKSGPAFNKVDNSQLVAVMRRDANKAADYARRHQVPTWYSNAADLLDDPLLNAIYIATPPSSHLEYALSALRKGKAVYVEKPVALNTDEATLLLETVKQTGGKLVVAHYRRQLPMFLKVKEILDTGQIGDVRTVQMRLWQSRSPEVVTKQAPNWRTDPTISGGGYFFDLAPHQLDLMLYFFGKPLSYEGFSQVQDKDSEVADQTTGTILFENQVVFNGSWCFNVSREDQVDRCEILGSRGSLFFSVFGDTVILKMNGDEKKFQFIHPENIQYPMISSTVAFFRNEGPNPASIEEAFPLMKIMDCFAKKR